MVWADTPTTKIVIAKRLRIMLDGKIVIREELSGEKNRKSLLPSIDLEKLCWGSFDEIWIWRPSWDPSAC